MINLCRFIGMVVGIYLLYQVYQNAHWSVFAILLLVYGQIELRSVMKIINGDD